MCKRKKVFISHNSDDKVYCDEIFRLVTVVIGDDRSKIFYSSKPKYGVPNGANIILTMKEQYKKYKLFMIIASSPHYYNSPKSLNEMGAAWVLNSKSILFMSPDASFSDLKGVIDASELAIQICDNEETRDRLDLFAEDLSSFFHIKMPEKKEWDLAKERFIKTIINSPSSISEITDISSIQLSESYKKLNDEKWVKELFGHFSFHLMQDYIQSGPEYIDARIPDSYDIWRNILNTYTFILYDDKLKSLIMSFYSLWDKIMVDNWKYYETAIGTPHRYHFYGLNSDAFISNDVERKFKETIDILLRMDPALRELAEYINQSYEINLDLLSSKFEKEAY